MRHRKPRRFHRHRSNDRGHHRRNGDREAVGVRPHSFTNGRLRNNFKLHQNPEKLAEKYFALAKEALSSGDKILSENYFQHADHFTRMTEQKNSFQNQRKNQAIEEQKINNNQSAEKDTINNDPSNQKKIVKEEKE